MFALLVLVPAAMSTILFGVIRQSEVLDGKPHITAVISGVHRNASSSFSDGVFHPRVCLGRVFSE